LASDLTGSVLNNMNNTGGQTQYSSDGRTIYSGYNFNATWSSDGRQFIYVEPTTSGENPTYSVGIFDIDKRQQMTLATYQSVNFSNSFFHTLRFTNLSSRIVEAIPYVPLSAEMIIPYLENGKISVVLTGGTMEKPIILVSNADHLLSLPSTLSQGQYWATDWYGVDHILIEWSTGQGQEKHLKLTTADANGANIRTVDEDLDDISNMNFIYAGEQPLLGFIGKKGERANLYMLDLDTGKQTLLLENVEDNSFWEVGLNPQHTLMSIRGNIIYPGGGQLYIRPVDNDALIKVDTDPNSPVIWSSDGKKIALISGTYTGAQHLHIVNADGQPITDYEIAQNALQNFFPSHWSKCY
jgi:hypothetical protein